MPVLVVELGAADAPLRLSLRPSQLSTPLCKAIWGDDVFELDRVLTATPEALTRLVDVGLPNPPVPPVMFAAWADRPLIVERLVRHYKANVNACDAEGEPRSGLQANFVCRRCLTMPHRPMCVAQMRRARERAYDTSACGRAGLHGQW